MLPRGERGSTCVLTVIDNGSKWLRIYPLRQHTAKDIIRALLDYLSSVPSCPANCILDNSPENCSDELSDFFKRFGIKKLHSAKYLSRANGQVERTHRDIQAQLRAFCTETNDWEKYIPRITICHNHSFHAGINRVPAAFIFEDAHEIAPEHLMTGKLLKFWRKGNPKFTGFALDSFVLKKKHFIGNRVTDKLVSRFSGPYQIENVRSNGLIYDLRHIDGSAEHNVHYDDLRSYKTPPEYLSNNVPFMQYYCRWLDQSGLKSTTLGPDHVMVPADVDDEIDPPIVDPNQLDETQVFNRRRSQRTSTTNSNARPTKDKRPTYPNNSIPDSSDSFQNNRRRGRQVAVNDANTSVGNTGPPATRTRRRRQPPPPGRNYNLRNRKRPPA